MGGRTGKSILPLVIRLYNKINDVIKRISSNMTCARSAYLQKSGHWLFMVSLGDVHFN